MNPNVDALLAVAIAASAAVAGVTLVSPTNTYAESTAEYTTTWVVPWADLKYELNSWRAPIS